MKNRMLALVTALVMAAASLGVASTLVSQASTETTTQTPKKCKKCKKVIKKAKKCKKTGNNSAKCKKAKKKAKKCKKVLKSRKCKPKNTNPSPKPSGSGSGGQEISGEIVQPNPVPDDPEACYAGKHRRALILSDGANQGVDGYHFDVDQKTVGGPFTLTLDSGEGEPDLDITFYTEYGTPEQAADPQHAPPNQAFEKREPGGETGTVPQGMKVAIVCMLNGANVAFTYKAGPGGPAPRPSGSASPSPSASAF